MLLCELSKKNKPRRNREEVGQHTMERSCGSSPIMFCNASEQMISLGEKKKGCIVDVEQGRALGRLPTRPRNWVRLPRLLLLFY